MVGLTQQQCYLSTETFAVPVGDSALTVRRQVQGFLPESFYHYSNTTYENKVRIKSYSY